MGLSLYATAPCFFETKQTLRCACSVRQRIISLAEQNRIAPDTGELIKGHIIKEDPIGIQHPIFSEELLLVTGKNRRDYLFRI